MVTKIFSCLEIGQQIKRFIAEHRKVQIYPFSKCLRLIMRKHLLVDLHDNKKREFK
jgi:hypothetical protein